VTDHGPPTADRDCRRLVVIADDFGCSSGVNDAVAEGHDRGIVTGTSVMAGGAAFDEAVRIAAARPGLSVGLHATFCDGVSVLKHSSIPGVVDAAGCLETSPAKAGIRYWRERRGLLPQLALEAKAQFERAASAGLKLAHVDGHHHLHIHPLLFDLVCGEAARRGVGWIRIPSGDLRDGRVVEWAVFGFLGRRNRRAADRHGLASPDRVFGLSRTGRVDEAYLLSLLPRLAPGWNELFVHPDLGSERGRAELDALTSPRVRARIADLGIALTAYGPNSSDRQHGGGPA